MIPEPTADDWKRDREAEYTQAEMVYDATRQAGFTPDVWPASSCLAALRREAALRALLERVRFEIRCSSGVSNSLKADIEAALNGA